MATADAQGRGDRRADGREDGREDARAKAPSAPRRAATRVWRLSVAALGRGRGLALVFLLALVALRAWDPTVLAALRFQALDFYQQSSPRERSNEHVVIVDIDEASIAELGQWPWSRARMADLTNALTDAGASAIGFDIVFSEPDRLSPPGLADQGVAMPDMIRGILSTLPDTDAQFGEAVARGPVVLGFAASEHRWDPDSAKGPHHVSHVAYRGDPSPFLSPFPAALRNIDVLEANAPGRGMFSLKPEHDGVVRRVPMVLRVGDEIYPSLTLEMLRVAAGASSFGTLLSQDGTGVESVGVAGITIPTDPNGRAWPHFARHNKALYVSALDILSGTADPERIRGKMVLVGTSAVGLRDLRLTVLAETVPGVEVHAQILQSALDGEFLRRPTYFNAMEHSVAIAGGLLLIAAAPALSAALSLPLFAAMLGGVWAGAYIGFQNMAAFDATYPTMAFIGVFALIAYANYARAETQKKQIRSAFKQFLSPDLVEKLADQPDALRLGGESREMTFLFCDIAGFTSFVEKADPQQLVELLNEYLDGVCQIIMDHGGTIDKIVGDAVHAMFNAPLDDPDHAANAVRAAVDIETFVNDFRERKAREGIDFGRTRIGVNTGHAVVGNFGGSSRFDYTAHGDAINTAARLEGVNKHLGTTICVSETSADLCPDLAFRPIAKLGLKGKQELVGTFEPVRPAGDAPDDARAPAERYQEVYALLDVCSDSVSKAFDDLAAVYPDDPLVALHRKRLAAGEASSTIMMTEK